MDKDEKKMEKKDQELIASKEKEQLEIQSELKAKLKEAESALQKEKSAHDKDLAEKKEITKKLDDSEKEV